jgi:hypothetical protein
MEVWRYYEDAAKFKKVKKRACQRRRGQDCRLITKHRGVMYEKKRGKPRTMEQII